MLITLDGHGLAHKDESYEVFTIFCKQIQNEKGCCISFIRSDHGGEFENQPFKIFCEENDISHEFSCPRTPQQNGVVERKNITLHEMARTMIHESNIAKHFWAEAVNTAFYIQNRIYIRPILNKTPYELWKGRKPNISYFHQFGCTCFILNTKDNLAKFDSKTHKGIFLGYSERSKAFRVYNKETLRVEESIHVKFNDKKSGNNTLELDEDFADLQVRDKQEETTPSDIKNDASDDKPVSASVCASGNASGTTSGDRDESEPEPEAKNNWRYKSTHPEDLIIGEPSRRVGTRRSFREQTDLALLSEIEPKTAEEALSDEGWILAMQEELN